MSIGSGSWPFRGQGRSTPCIGDGHPTWKIGNPYNGYINPYYWVDDHPLLYGNNWSLDPSTFRGQVILLPILDLLVRLDANARKKVTRPRIFGPKWWWCKMVIYLVVFLRGVRPRGGGNWGTLGKIRGITTSPETESYYPMGFQSVK